MPRDNTKRYTSGRTFDMETGGRLGEWESTSYAEALHYATSGDAHVLDALGGQMTVTEYARRDEAEIADGVLLGLRDWEAPRSPGGSSGPTIRAMATFSNGIVTAFPARAGEQAETVLASTYREWDLDTGVEKSHGDLTLEKLDVVNGQGLSGQQRKSDTEDKDYWRCRRSQTETIRQYMALRQLSTGHVSAVMRRRPELFTHMGFKTVNITGVDGLTQAICIANNDNSVDVHCATKNHGKLSTVVTTVIGEQCRTCVPVNTAKDIATALRRQGDLLLVAGDRRTASHANSMASAVDASATSTQGNVADPDVMIDGDIAPSLSILGITPQSGGIRAKNGSKLSVHHANRLAMLATSYQAAQNIIMRQQAGYGHQQVLGE